MKKILCFLSFLASSASADVLSTDCEPVGLNAGATEWAAVVCTVRTTDAGPFTIRISSTTTRLRANGDGSIQSADLTALRGAIQTEYRAGIVVLRSEEAAAATVEEKRRRASFKMTPAQVE